METNQTVIAGIPSLLSGNTPDAAHPMFSGFDSASAVSFIRKYDPTAIKVEGYRHAVIRFRVTGKDAVEKPARMATIPDIKLDENSYLLPDTAKQVLIGILEDQQDIIIRSAIENSKTTIDWDSLSVDSCLAALTAVRVSSRLTREGIEQWFMVSPLVPACTKRGEQIAEAKNYDEIQTKKQIAGTINSYKENFGKLAAAVPNIGMDTATSLQNMLKVSGACDDIGKSLARKLHAILNPAAANDL